MSTLAACPHVQTADAYRAAFGALAHDKLLEHGARAARQLAYAITSCETIYELYAVSRFLRRTAHHADGMAPIASYLDGLYFYRVHRSDDPANDIDFDALKEAAWNYVDFLEEDI